METVVWIRRFVLAFGVAVLLITGAQVLRGHELRYALVQGLIWGAVSAAIFTYVQIRKFRNGMHCAVCADRPVTATAATGDAQPARFPHREQ